MPTFVNSLLLSALTIVSPTDGETVKMQSQVHRDYLALPRKERMVRFDNPATRDKLVKVSDVQPPVEISWESEAGVIRLSVERLRGEESETVGVYELTNTASARITNLELGATYRCTVATPEGEKAECAFQTDATPPRLMRIEGVDNFRDLGGWTGLDGRKVRQGRVYRSSALRSSSKNKGGDFVASKYESGTVRITPEALEYAKGELGVHTDIELRSVQETVFMKESLFGSDVRWVKTPYVAYEYIDNLERGREPFEKIFRNFLKEENYPILMHCSGGRDRTGTVAFLLNGLLGVSEDDLSRDWETSAFANSSLKFNSRRIQGLIKYLNSLGGSTMTENCELYARSCGITDEEIARFRELMLEGGAR